MKNKTANKICETKECSQTENNKTCLHLLSIYDMLGSEPDILTDFIFIVPCDIFIQQIFIKCLQCISHYA